MLRISKGTISIIQRIVFATVFVVLVQLACSSAERGFSPTSTVLLKVEIPLLTMRGEEYSFVLSTVAGAKCHAGVAFWDIKSDWVILEFSTIKADQAGICEWQWE